jgi:gas vesicle protein
MFKKITQYTIQKKSKVRGKIAFAAAFAGLVGAGFALFSSPKSGKENRQAVVKKSKEVLDGAKVQLESKSFITKSK